MNKDNKKSVRTFSPMYSSSPFDGSKSKRAKIILEMRNKFGGNLSKILKNRGK